MVEEVAFHHAYIYENTTESDRGKNERGVITYTSVHNCIITIYAFSQGTNDKIIITLETF